MKEGSQKIISQGRKLSSSLDYGAVDVYCSDAMNDREAVADAVVAGAVRDAAADAKSMISGHSRSELDEDGGPDRTFPVNSSY